MTGRRSRARDGRNEPGDAAERVVACGVAELREGEPRFVKVANRDLVLIMWRGQIYALRNRCSHQGAALAQGIVSGRVIAGRCVGQPDVDDEAPVLACPWHGWEFDLRSGVVVGDPTQRVITYPAAVVGSDVVVTVKRRGGG